VLALGVALALAGCRTAPALRSPAAAAAAPGSSNLKPIDQAALQSVIAAAAKEMLIPGALVLLRTPLGEVVVSYGTTQLGTTSPPRPDTHFRIASNTKTMTAAIVVQLAQEGRLELDDPISKYVRGVPNGERITIAELLDMRSGLYNYTDAPELSAAIDRDPATVWTPRRVLAIAFARPPRFAPGTAYEYCNTNYALLGLVIEQLDGKSLARSMSDRLFGPLGLRHTMLPGPTTRTLPPPYSDGYLYGGASVALMGEPPYSAATKAAARAGTLEPTDYTEVNHSFAAAAGGVVSTAADVAVWIEALVDGRVLDRAYQRRWRESLRPVDPTKPGGQRYGYGISSFQWGPNRMLFHGGETVGFNSFIGHDPTNDVTLVVWSNLTVSLDDAPTANALMLNVLDQIYAVSPRG